MYIRLLYIFTLISFYIAAGNAKDLRFQHLSIEQGLSHNTVNCIYKDSFGFIWFGTSDGLNQYDGYEVKVYRNDPLNPYSLIDNKIYAIVEDTNGDLWIGSRDGLNIFNREKQSFSRPSEQGNFPENVFVRTITIDDEGTLWVGTLGDGIFYKLKDEELFKPYIIPEENQISSISFDQDGVMWVASGRSAGVYKVNLKKERTYEFISFGEDAKEWHKNRFTGKTIVPGYDDKLWICTEGFGLFLYDKKNNQFRHFHTESDDFSLSNNIVKDVEETPEGDVYIATDGGGLNVYDVKSGSMARYRYDINESAGISSDAVYSTYLDNTGILWVGTFGGGLSIYNQNIKNFEHHSQLGWNKNSLSHKSVLCFEEDHKGVIWIGTDGGGLNAYNPSTGKFSHFKHNPGNPHSINSNVITAIYEDSYHTLWIGTFANGLSRFNRETGHFEKINYNQNDSLQLVSNNVWNITEDQRGYLWIATLDGLARINLATGDLKNYLLTHENDDAQSNRVTYLLNDSRGNLWIGSQPLFRYDYRADEFIPISPPDNVISQAMNKGIRCIYENSNGKLWVGTEGGGLVGFDPALNRWEVYTEHYGLSSNAIHQILEDSTGNLWVSSNQGITRINPANRQFRIYDINDGLQSNQFSYSAALQSSDGKMYFGGINGFNVFDPHKIFDNPHIPPVWITNFRLSNRDVEIDTEDSPLDKSILLTNSIKLPHKAVFTFEFTALNYTSTRKNLYQYQLEGFSEEWTDPSTRRNATYTNLDPGKYIFKVRASNNDGLWNYQGDRIEVIVLPPIWKSNYAYILYILIIVGIFIGFRSYLVSKQEMKNRLLIKDIEKKKIEEVNRLKLLFFTNISHEFRTPLTLIIGPVKQILQSNECNDVVTDKLKMVENNTQRLLNLVNQIIEFRKIETGNTRLKLSSINAVEFIKNIKKAFDQYAYDHSISYGFITNVEKAEVWLDKDKIDKILFNLLSNAFKFTPEGGKITISISIIQKTNEEDNGITGNGRMLRISVSDTGIGIPEEKIKKIFDRFYQVDKSEEHKEKARFLGTAGSGIGLSLTRELVINHKGEIKVQSQLNKGSKFIVMLPAEKEAYAGEEFTAERARVPELTSNAMPQSIIPKNQQNVLEPQEKERSRLLIVEDNAELRVFLYNTLSNNYFVYQADNGLEGYEIAQNKMPDIIITDIMMPVMDGIEMTKKLAGNASTDHIPIILLTAKSSDEAMLEGLEVGAVDYIIKPFSPDVLVHKIKNITNTRLRFKEKFKQEIILQPKEVTITSQEEKFLSKAMEVIEKHISDPAFDVSAFVSEMAMSRSVLYRKLDAVIGTSANEFIRQVRLKRAAQLLQTNQMKIADVSYAVGFNDPQYFSKCFSKEFGKTPTAYASAYKKDAQTH